MMNFSAPALMIGLIGWLLLLWWLRHREAQNRPNWVDSADLLAGGLLFLTTMAFFWRTLVGDVFQPADGGDLVSFLFPTYRFAAGQISQWSLPLWNPHLYGGAPFISDIQAGFLYPPNLLLFLLNPTFDYRVMQQLSQLHIFWAGLGTYLLVRSLCWQGWTPSRSAAFLAALAFQFSDPFLIHLGNLNLIAVLSWLPWILAAFHRALTQQSLRWSAIAALLFALANYAGHAQSSIYLGFAVGLYWLIGSWCLAPCPSPETSTPTANPLLASIIYPLATVILTLLLTAPLLLPAIEMSAYTERADLSYQETTQFSLAPTQAIGLITPSFFGRGPALHWSLWDRVETPYAGIITLMLAILGLVLASHAQRRRLWPWFGLALFGFVTALGVYSILHGWLTLIVPGFDQFRAPARALVLWTLGVSVMAAFGVDRIIELTAQQKPTGQKQTKQRGQRGNNQQAAPMNQTVLRTGAIFLGGAVLPLSYLSLLLTQDSDTMFLRASVAAIALTVATLFWLAGWALIVAYRAGWMNASNFGWLMAALLFAELTANGGAYLDVSETDPTTGYNHPEIIEFLKGDPDLLRIDTRTDIQALWQPDAAAYHGLQDVWGVANPLVLEPWKRLWDATGGRQSRVYDMLNVKYVLVPDGVPLPDGKFELALDAPGELSVHRNLDFMPRAWVVHQAEVVPNQEVAFAALRREDFDPTQTVILTDAQALPAAGADPNATASVVHYGSSEMTIQVNTAAPGYLVISEIWYPGWQATVNGQTEAVLQANGAQRAIPVPAGESAIQLWFSPRGWWWGLGGWLIGVILFAAALSRIHH